MKYQAESNNNPAVGVVDLSGCSWNPFAHHCFLQAVCLSIVDHVILPQGAPHCIPLELHATKAKVESAQVESIQNTESTCSATLLGEEDNAKLDEDLGDEFAETQECDN